MQSAHVFHTAECSRNWLFSSYQLLGKHTKLHPITSESNGHSLSSFQNNNPDMVSTPVLRGPPEYYGLFGCSPFPSSHSPWYVVHLLSIPNSFWACSRLTSFISASTGMRGALSKPQWPIYAVWILQPDSEPSDRIGVIKYHGLSTCGLPGASFWLSEIYLHSSSISELNISSSNRHDWKGITGFEENGKQVGQRLIRPVVWNTELQREKWNEFLHLPLAPSWLPKLVITYHRHWTLGSIFNIRS